MLDNKKVYYIYGASGAGSTTLGEALCKKMNYELIDTDDYFWKYPKMPDMQIKKMYEDMINTNKNGIVITGSFWNWNTDYTYLLDKIDVFVRTMLNSEIRIARLEKRELERYGERILEGGDLYEKHINFIKWAKDYDTGDISTRSLKAHMYFEDKYNIKPIIVNSENAVKENLIEIIEKKV